MIYYRYHHYGHNFFRCSIEKEIATIKDSICVSISVISFF